MMKPLSTSWNDDRVEQLIGRLLRWGVLLSAVVVICGAAVYLAHHGSSHPQYSVFRGEPAGLHSPSGIVHGLFHGSASDWIQLGLLLLIATPVARVAFSVFAFLFEGDLMYVGVTMVVFAVLIYSIFAG
jgi:uncharacterized membrane protein